MTPIAIITGFLGSGKTTMLRKLLERGFGGRRVALIVNEFGEVGFDGQAVEGLHVERMIELTSGCICCSVGTDFLLAVEEIIDTTQPDLIVVETTGLAEPWSLIKRVRASGLPLDTVVTLVDAANLERELDMAQVARWQVRAADFLILNKCDLVTPAQLAHVRTLLREQNERAAIIEVIQGEVDPRRLFGIFTDEHGMNEVTSKRSAPSAMEDSDHLHEDAIETLLWQHNQPLERGKIEAALRELPPYIYRTKGIIHCTDAPWATRVNGVCGRVDYETTRLKTPPLFLNQLVFIGTALEGLRDNLFARLATCADTSERTAAWHSRNENNA
ncbi:MAG: GTP-binding protein [Chloroflexaceae bacterium]|jgi:G3E family GTPase|nr:GTP-binding protein [Chloroflexaceae bacterium]